MNLETRLSRLEQNSGLQEKPALRVFSDKEELEAFYSKNATLAAAKTINIITGVPRVNNSSA